MRRLFGRKFSPGQRHADNADRHEWPFPRRQSIDRYKTTEQVERAFVEDKNFDFLYADADGYHFMNADTYDQLQVPRDIIGDQAQWLQEGMKVILSLFDGSPVAIQLPPRVTLEVVETEPAMKGQTASFLQTGEASQRRT